MKIAYIAHPISGDVPGNISKILDIVRQINKKEPNVVPFAPYLVDCLAMQDHVPEERARGIANHQELFNRMFIDELWPSGTGYRKECGTKYTCVIPWASELYRKLRGHIEHISSRIM